MSLELTYDVWEKRHDQRLKSTVADIPRRNQQKSRWTSPEQMPIDEVSILRNDYSLLPVGQIVDLSVGCSVPVR